MINCTYLREKNATTVCILIVFMLDANFKHKQNVFFAIEHWQEHWQKRCNNAMQSGGVYCHLVVKQTHIFFCAITLRPPISPQPSCPRSRTSSLRGPLIPLPCHVPCPPQCFPCELRDLRPPRHATPATVEPVALLGEEVGDGGGDQSTVSAGAHWNHVPWGFRHLVPSSLVCFPGPHLTILIAALRGVGTCQKGTCVAYAEWPPSRSGFGVKVLPRVSNGVWLQPPAEGGGPDHPSVSHPLSVTPEWKVRRVVVWGQVSLSERRRPRTQGGHPPPVWHTPRNT